MSSIAPLLLLTRPASHEIDAETHAAELADILRLPLIEVHPAVLDDAMQARLVAARNADVLIFVSTTAAESVYALAPQLRCNRDARWCAVGPSTARRIHELFDVEVLQPAPDAANSEGLLALLEHVAGLSCAIFAAPEGRMLLATTLRQRGARVEIIEVYQRQLAVLSASKLEALRAHRARLVVTATSMQLLHAVAALLNKLDWSVAEIPLIVSAARIAESARALGFVDVRLALSAANPDLIRALKLPSTH